MFIYNSVGTGFWEIFSRFLKVNVPGSIFSLKLSSRLKTMLTSIKNWKDSVKLLKSDLK